jgi:hypothetical protein
MTEAINSHLSAIAAGVVVVTTISIGWLWSYQTSAQSVVHESAEETSIRHIVEKLDDDDEFQVRAYRGTDTQSLRGLALSGSKFERCQARSTGLTLEILCEVSD